MRKSPLHQKRLSIKGIVTPFSWDASGRVTAVSISAAAETEYVVAGTGKGRELLRLIHEPVRVSGVLKRDRHGRQVIMVDAYRILRSGDECETDFADSPPETGDGR